MNNIIVKNIFCLKEVVYYVSKICFSYFNQTFCSKFQYLSLRETIQSAFLFIEFFKLKYQLIPTFRKIIHGETTNLRKQTGFPQIVQRLRGRNQWQKLLCKFTQNQFSLKLFFYQCQNFNSIPSHPEGIND